MISIALLPTLALAARPLTGPVGAILTVTPASVRWAQPTDYVKAWDDLAKAIQTRYYARKTRGKEMDALLKKYEPLGKAAKSEEEFADITNQMIADFKDSHFALLTNQEQSYYVFEGLMSKDPKPAPFFGAWVKKMPDGYTVKMVLNGSEAETADLRKGDLILKVNNQTFTPIQSLAPFVNQKVKLSIRRGEADMEKEVTVTSKPVLGAFLDASRASSRVIESHGRKIGYFHLWTMANDDFRNALAGAVYGKFRETDAVILDLRDGFGGRPEGFGDPFFRPEVTTTWDMGGGMAMPQLFGYQRPLVVLINAGSRSAKEIFSYVIKKSHRATLIGSTTAGNVLGTTPWRLTDWAFLEIPIVDIKTDGERLEGRGVDPDIKVPAEFDDSGKDLVLDAALNRLRNVRKYSPK